MFLYPICLWPAFPFLHISVSYLLFYIAMGAHWPALRVVLSFFRGFAATSDKVRWGGMNVKTPARRFYNHSLVLSRLKNFVKVPGCTGFCVDTENAAVWASASSAFSVSFLAKFCTPWYLRSSELRQIQRRLYKFPFLEFICFKFPSPGILYPIFLLGNTVIRALPAADVPSSFGSL